MSSSAFYFSLELDLNSCSLSLNQLEALSGILLNSFFVLDDSYQSAQEFLAFCSAIHVQYFLPGECSATFLILLTMVYFQDTAPNHKSQKLSPKSSSQLRTPIINRGGGPPPLLYFDLWSFFLIPPRHLTNNKIKVQNHLKAMPYWHLQCPPYLNSGTCTCQKFQ